MAKAKKKGQMVRKRRALQVPRGLPGGSPAAAYANLLMNPCTAPLVHPVGPGQGGFLARVETDFLLGNGATDTAGFFRWAPGAICLGTSGDAGLAWSVGVNDTTSLTAGGGNANLYVPGYQYLTGNARSARCVAACIQVYWPGTELNRQGIISGVVAPSETIALLPTATAITVASVRAGSGFTQRMPTEKMEIRWSPSPSDLLYEATNATAAGTTGHNALIISWAGLPVATGVRIRCVAVYEWLPQMVNGFITSADAGVGAPASRLLVNDVLNGLRAAFGEWRFPREVGAAFEAAKFAYRGISSVVGYAARKARGVSSPDLLTY